MDIRRVGSVTGKLSQPVKKDRVKPKSSQTSKDSIEISESARAAQEVRSLANLASASGDVRPERVQEVRQLLAEGVLMSDESTARLAEKLVDLL